MESISCRVGASRLLGIASAIFFAAAPLASQVSATAEVLPGTALWNFPEDIVAEQYSELRNYYETQIASAAGQRDTYWKRDLSSADAYRNSIGENITAFRRMIGLADQLALTEPVLEPIGSTGSYTATFVDLPLRRSGGIGPRANSYFLVHIFGILLRPKGRGPFPAVVAVPDAIHSAADIAGLTPRLPADQQYARNLAASGYLVFAPFCVQRRTFSQPWLEDRTWLFRLAYLTGRHPIGSEVQQISLVADYLSSLNDVDPQRLAVAGSGQGGLLALYSAALDTRLKAALVANYFGPREQAYDEPEDRLLWSHLIRFGDAEIASMILPRRLIVVAADDERLGAVRGEFAKVQGLYQQIGAENNATLVEAAVHDPVIDANTIRLLSQALGPVEAAAAFQTGAASQTAPKLETERLAQIANSQFKQWEAAYKNLTAEAYRVRDSNWRPDTSSIEKFRRSVEPQMEAYFDSVGRYSEPAGPFDALSVKLYDEAGFTGYRLRVRVYDGVHAYGVLLVPKGVRPGERRPVVFTQHGYGDAPEDALGVDTTAAKERLYARFGKSLAERGYVVFAPMISVQNGAERTRLVRRSQLLGMMPVGMEMKKFGRVLDFLATLPIVDTERAAFYGLSYGGYTALRIGPGEPRFKVVINSADFNETTLKRTDLTQSTSFIFYDVTIDRYIFGWLNYFSDSILAALIAPRAYMTEIGDFDAVVMEPRRFVDIEIADYLNIYRQLGISDKGRVSRHSGPHQIDGRDTFPFLDRWLGWQPPNPARGAP